MKVLNLTYKLTNLYLIQSSGGWIMVDAGWPNTLPQVLQLLKQKDVHTKDIKYLVVTHFHPDHAGLVQDLRELGIKLILQETQVSFVYELNNHFKKNTAIIYKDIIVEKSIILSSAESKEFLISVGIDGVLMPTPGHSDDSISLIINDYCAFTGDLPEFSTMEAYHDQTIIDSWKLIKDYNVKKIYPAHGNPYTL